MEKIYNQPFFTPLDYLAGNNLEMWNEIQLLTLKKFFQVSSFFSQKIREEYGYSWLGKEIGFVARIFTGDFQQ